VVRHACAREAAEEQTQHSSLPNGARWCAVIPHPRLHLRACLRIGELNFCL